MWIEIRKICGGSKKDTSRLARALWIEMQCLNILGPFYIVEARESLVD